MKAILVQVSNKSSKVCSTSVDAINFIKSCNIIVNSKSVDHINNGYDKINLQSHSSYVFSAGNNSGNPSIYLTDVTGKSSIAEMSPSNIREAVKDVESEIQKIASDFRLDVFRSDASVIEGGFNWYWSQSSQRHFPIYELWMKTTSFNSIVELKEALLSKGLELISKYGKEN